MSRTNTKVIQLLILLTSLLLVETACKNTSSNTQTISKTTEDVTFWLDSEKIGGLSDLGTLKKRIEEISQKRTNAGIFADGSNEIKNRVYLIIDSNLSLRNLKDVLMASRSYYIPSSSIKELNGARDPLLRVLHIQGPSKPKPKMPNYPAFLYPKDSKQFHNLVIATVDKTDPDANHRQRITRNSIEINSNGEYFFNEKADMSNRAGKRVTGIPIKQRRIEKVNLRSEIEKMKLASKYVHIIANENLGYEIIKEIMELTNDLDLRYFVITVDDN